MNGRILVLDDSKTLRREVADELDREFEVVIVTNFEDALALCEHWLPDTIVLDIENIHEGIESCRVLGIRYDVPVVFCAADTSLDFQMAALEAGAADFLAKPIYLSPLLHKIQRTVEYRRKHLQIELERNNLRATAMSFLSSLGQSGILMNFVRSSIRCNSFEDLAERLVDAARELGISCFGEIRACTKPVPFRTEMEISELEESVMSKLTTMGRIFQFHTRLVVNYPQVSIIVRNFPKDSDELAGKIRDNIAILAETADALCENVQVRMNATAHAEQLQFAMMQANAAAIALRDNTKLMLMDTRLLLQELDDNLQQAHSWLGTTSDQERAISEMTNTSIQRILGTISRVDIDDQMKAILLAMSADKKSNSDLELF